MSFPFLIDEQPLVSDDLSLLAPLLRQSVQVYLPCAGVYFVGPQVSGDGLPAVLRAGVEVVRSGLQPVKDRGDNPALYLPLWSDEQLWGVAVLAGVENGILDLPVSRLLEKSKILSREMLLVKQAALDPVTGLAGGRLLMAALAELLAAGDDKGQRHCLLMVEMAPREKRSDRAIATLQKNGASLHSLIGHLAPPCHLGNGVFVLLWQGIAEGAALKMADQLLQWQKREMAGQTHIGLVEFGAEEGHANIILDQAWQALATARKRGPFGLCPYASVVGRADHPLSLPPTKVIAELRRHWRKVKSFALVEWRRDGENDVFPVDQVVVEGDGAEFVAVSPGQGYVFFPCKTERKAEEWCRQAQGVLAKLGLSFSMGVSYYPTHDFKKVEMVTNCRKALLHTAFFGAATFTLFDGVSLNISGDIYYNEGDMARAAREYQHGLQIDPKNVNLLNSLGVTHAQMARYQKAIPLFKRVLEIDRSNFMALCNLGFALLAGKNVDEAVAAFEEALLCRDDYFDLLLQLGKLYLDKGCFAQAAKVLRQAEKVGPAGIRDVSHGAVHRFLGQACHGLGQSRAAMTSLQRAVRYNPRDADSLSLLGLLYSQQGEGAEIARTFCVQAVEIDELVWRYWLRLAQVEMTAGEVAEARKALQESKRLAPRQGENFMVQGELAQLTGDIKAARDAYLKALSHGADEKSCRRMLARLAENLG